MFFRFPMGHSQVPCYTFRLHVPIIIRFERNYLFPTTIFGLNLENPPGVICKTKVSGLLCRNVFVDPLQDRRWFSSSDSPQTKMQTSWVAPAVQFRNRSASFGTEVPWLMYLIRYVIYYNFHCTCIRMCKYMKNLSHVYMLFNIVITTPLSTFRCFKQNSQ